MSNVPPWHWTNSPRAEEIRERLRNVRLGKKGRPLSEENKQKMILARKQSLYVPTDEHKSNISKALTGIDKSYSTRAKMSVVAKARDFTKSFHSPEARIKAKESLKGKRPWHAGKPMPVHFRVAISLSMKGKPKSCAHRLKMSESRRGEKSHFWRGGVHKINQRERTRLMRTLEYRLWREQVFERDKHTCQMKDDSCSGPNQADHIKSWKDYPELRYEVSNGRTLCKSHHERTPNFVGRVFKRENVG